MKKRILMCGESSHIASGFGNYTRNILQRLHNTGKYEIAELSCYRDNKVPKTEPWKVYPVAVPHNDPLHSEYTSNDMNQFGQWRFELALMDFKPHIVFDIRDFWNFTYQETTPLRNFYHWMVVPTYDSDPQKIDTINLFYNTDMLGFHTNWAKNNLLNDYHYTGDNIRGIFSDAVDHNVFKPMSCNKETHKIKFNISSDTFVIGSVMRNQKRKLIPDLLHTFSKLINNNSDKKIILYLHTSYPDGLAWDLPSLLLEYNIADKVLLTYKCTSCSKYFPSVFQGVRTICRHCNQDSANIASVRNNITENELNEIYNIFDVYVQYAICEGFGIPVVEAAACGVPVITIDHGAMGEVGKNVNATLVPVDRVFREQETNARRIYPNNEMLLSELQKMINMDSDMLLDMGSTARKCCLNSYNWDYTAKGFEEVFDSVDTTKKNSWDSDIRPVDGSYTLNHNESIRVMIYDAIDNILKEPSLKSTNFIEELIKNTYDGFVMVNNKSYPVNIKSVIQILELYLKNKGSIEAMRLNSSQIITSEKLKPFFDYSKL